LTIGQVLHQINGNPEALENEVMQLALALVEAPEQNEVQEAYDAALERLNRSDIGRIQATLAAFGLADMDDEQPVGTLSGGQKTRLTLALVLLSEPQFLLLDEPTNHLDIEMLEWLEAWLNNFSGGALIVSHDRTFLDQTITRILDLDPESHTIRDYAGNYSDYLEQYRKEREKQRAAYKDQVYEIRRLRQDIAQTKEQARWVERTTTPRDPGVRRYAKKVARKAKAREKKLDRYLASDERVEKPTQSWQMKVELDNTARLGRDVLTLADLAVGYPGQEPLLRHLNQHVQAGQRIVLTGPNGAGKTTLLRTIAGRLPSLAGQVRLGASVRLGYMAQEQESLDPTRTPLETIRQAAPMNQTEARSFLHFFLFSGDDALRPNQHLSFGERARLSLAVLVASGCNFLLLDEPINHLDIPSRTRFEAALSHFEGTALAVAHDRYFIDRFATEVWWVVNQGLAVELRHH
jgi:ATP-binding cassette subfamily F protein 3